MLLGSIWESTTSLYKDYSCSLLDKLFRKRYVLRFKANISAKPGKQVTDDKNVELTFRKFEESHFDRNCILKKENFGKVKNS